MGPILLDLNEPQFQDDLLNLAVEEAARVLNSLRKIRKLSWEGLYRDKGLRWEAIDSTEARKSGRLYSFRVTRKMRAVAYRDKDWLRLVSLHPDHDSAYQ